MESALDVADGKEAPSSLVDGKGARLHAVCVREGLGCVFIRTGRHEQVTSIGVDHWVLRLEQDEFLKVQECLTCVTDQICALASEEVGVKELVVQVDYFREISNGLLEHREAGVASAFMQQISCIRLFFARRRPLEFDDRVDVAECLIEVVEVVEDVAAREQQVPVSWTKLQALVNDFECCL